jgi:hypothetical protein
MRNPFMATPHGRWYVTEWLRIAREESEQHRKRRKTLGASLLILAIGLAAARYHDGVWDTSNVVEIVLLVAIAMGAFLWRYIRAPFLLAYRQHGEIEAHKAEIVKLQNEKEQLLTVIHQKETLTVARQRIRGALAVHEDRMERLKALGQPLKGGEPSGERCSVDEVRAYVQNFANNVIAILREGGLESHADEMTRWAVIPSDETSVDHALAVEEDIRGMVRSNLQQGNYFDHV